MNLDHQTKQAIRTALQGEQRAARSYAAALDRFGPSPVNRRLKQAERRHTGALARLLDSDESESPNLSSKVAPRVPDRYRAALRTALRLEAESIAMYDRLLEQVDHPGVRSVFARLRTASADRHHAALKRTHERASGRRR